jgi:hypothetical protein
VAWRTNASSTTSVAGGFMPERSSTSIASGSASRTERRSSGEVHVFLAEELGEAGAESGEDERIEPVAWALDRVDELIAETRDAKTLIGLLLLERVRRRAQSPSRLA